MMPHYFHPYNEFYCPPSFNLLDTPELDVKKFTPAIIYEEMKNDAGVTYLLSGVAGSIIVGVKAFPVIMRRRIVVKLYFIVSSEGVVQTWDKREQISEIARQISYLNN